MVLKFCRLSRDVRGCVVLCERREESLGVNTNIEQQRITSHQLLTETSLGSSHFPCASYRKLARNVHESGPRVADMSNHLCQPLWRRVFVCAYDVAMREHA